MNGSSDIASYRLPLSIGMLVVLLVWELMSPYFAAFTQGEGVLKRRALNAATNLGFGLLNAVVVAGVFVGLWAMIATWSATHQFGLLHWLPLPAVASWMLAILLLDSWTYLWHRLNHVIPFLWRFHRLHHSDREMNVTTANRFHVGEVILSSVLRLPLLAVLGVQLEQLALYEVMLFAVVQFHHANIGLPEWLDRALRWIIVTPHLHKVHHSVIRVEADSNFSALFSWWDRVFRTFRLSPQPRQIVFGVDNER